MTETSGAGRVSVHGGHTAEFGDGKDTLAEVVAEYARQGFAWVGLTEHVPPAAEEFLFPQDIEAGATVASKTETFAQYFATARRLQAEYAPRLQVFVGFETECYTGYIDHINGLRREYEPDYIVGSVHHVRDAVIDGRKEWYADAIERCGGVDELYCTYFDQQYELMEAFQPEVIGHFDLIRFHDTEYRKRVLVPAIQDRIRRNLVKAKEIDAILDLNLRALEKGASEPYITRSILQMAADIGVKCAPGDDSHGVATVGGHMELGIELLHETGFPLDWPKPRGC